MEAFVANGSSEKGGCLLPFLTLPGSTHDQSSFVPAPRPSLPPAAAASRRPCSSRAKDNLGHRADSCAPSPPG